MDHRCSRQENPRSEGASEAEDSVVWVDLASCLQAP